ncbi:MAG: tRNA ((37)-N6)-dimethylallyltransferase MiaA [Solirubrobacterales bacterium]|nr:tRNA ((37)-N6)-dimethylallyltransferase MiaA [Solirubrobacterales bacterium]
MPPSVLALFGPTGVGKTALAHALADRLRTQGRRPVAVSADALQVYAGLERLTGAADAADRARLEHRLVGVVPVRESFSAGAYAARAHAEIDELLAEGATPIVVGGTGLYLRAALADLDLRPAVDPALRAHWQAVLDAEGPRALHEALTQRDPELAALTQPTDAHRLVRALELLDAGQAPPRPGASQLWTTETRHPTRLIGLTMERAALDAAIDARVDAMLSAGVVGEVRAAAAAGASETARKALGFRELLDGDVDLMKQRTRRYARRQLTWMRKLPAVELVDVTGRDAAEVAVALLP